MPHHDDIDRMRRQLEQIDYAIDLLLKLQLKATKDVKTHNLLNGAINDLVSTEKDIKAEFKGRKNA